MAQKSSAPTIEVVARHAGVSPMTVSRVINGADGVRESTRARVNEAIAALNYRPNAAAQRLAGSEQVRLGVLCRQASAVFMSEVFVGLLDQASRSHVQLVVEKCELSDADLADVRTLISSGIDGMILPPPLCDSPALLELMREMDIPTALIASARADGEFHTIRVDDYRAAFEMTRHLIALGHRRIGFINGNPDQSVSAPRLIGYRAAIAAAELPQDNALVATGLFSYRSGLDATESLLALDPRPTAIFAANDDMAAAAVAVAHRQGLDVPGDLTVVGFDDTAIATTIWPELSTIHQPVAEMARAAVEALVRQVRARRNGQPETYAHSQVGFELIRRQSDAPPRVRPPLRVNP